MLTTNDVTEWITVSIITEMLHAIAIMFPQPMKAIGCLAEVQAHKQTNRQTSFICVEGINMNTAGGWIHHPVVAEGKIEPICQKLHILRTLWQNIPKQINLFFSFFLGGGWFWTRVCLSGTLVWTLRMETAYWASTHSLLVSERS